MNSTKPATILNRFNLIYLCGASLIAGCLLPCAFAPLSYWWLAILCPLALIHACKNASAKQATIIGWIFGLGFFGVGASWIHTSIFEFGHTPKFVADIITIAFVAILAVYPAYFAYLLKKCFHNYNYTALCVGLPCAWVLLECLRSWLFTGFPWLLMGYSQLNTPLKYYAPIISVYGVSFLVLVTVGLLYKIIDFKVKWSWRKFTATAVLCAIWLGGYVLQNITWTHLQNSAQNSVHSVSLIQANLTPEAKSKLTLAGNWQVYGPLTMQSLNSSLIIWPEHSVPVILPVAQPFISELDQLGKMHNATIIVGVADKIPNVPHYYNSLIAVGAGSGFYHKKHLVPFGEYLPFADYIGDTVKRFGIQYSLFKAGPAVQGVIHLPHSTLLPLICYEIAYVETVRENLVISNASAIVNISEDGWFGDSWGPAQHLDIARMRALETGRYVLRSTTSGISAIIDNHGAVVAAIPLFSAQALHGEYKDCTGLTPWCKIGLNFLMGLILIVFIYSLRSCTYN